MDRFAYFFEQLVVAADLNTAQDHEETADRSIVADILGYGFLVSGTNPATVVQNTPSTDLNVKVNQFLGYDQGGKRLSNLRSGYEGNVNKGAPPPQRVDLSVDELSASTAVAGVGNEKTVSIFIQFRRNPYTDRTDGNNVVVKYNQDESIQFNVVQSAEALIGASVKPPYRTDQLLLCDVVLIKNQTAIVNANISLTRQQAFQLVLPHGNSHISTGTDPIPGANGGAGGLMSAADYTKLSGITFTKAGIGALFDNQFHLYKPANISSPAGLTLDVTGRMAGIPAGGSASKEGAVTQVGAASGDNVVYLLDSNGNEVKSSANNRIYGKLTADDETTPTAWTLSFYSQIAGVETAYDFTPQAGITLQWWVNRAYRLDHLPSNVKPWLLPRNRMTGGGVAGEKNTAGLTGYQPIVNFIQGSNITLSVVENTSNKSIDVTIASSASGAFPGFGSATGADTPGGNGGGSGVAADAGHQHTLSSQYGLAVQGVNGSNATSWGTSVAHPRIAVGMGSDGAASPVGIACDPGPIQASTQGTGAFTTGKFLSTSGGSAQFTAWSSGTQTLTATHAFTATFFVLGQSGL